MTFNKNTYYDNFKRHVELCIYNAQKKLDKKIPNEVKCYFGFEELYENAKSKGFVKSLGGRLLKPEELRLLSIIDVAKYTYVNGKIPVWINLYFEGFDENYSFVRIVTSDQLTDDEALLYDMPEGTKQFHLLMNPVEILRQPS